MLGGGGGAVVVGEGGGGAVVVGVVAGEGTFAPVFPVVPVAPETVVAVELLELGAVLFVAAPKAPTRMKSATMATTTRGTGLLYQGFLGGVVPEPEGGSGEGGGPLVVGGVAGRSGGAADSGGYHLPSLAIHHPIP